MLAGEGTQAIQRRNIEEIGNLLILKNGTTVVDKCGARKNQIKF